MGSYLMNDQIKKIVIGAAGAIIIIVAGVVFVMDAPQQNKPKRTTTVEHPPYQSKIVPIEKSDKRVLKDTADKAVEAQPEVVAKRTPKPQANKPAPVVKVPKESNKKTDQITEIKTPTQDSTSQPQAAQQLPKAQPTAKRVVAEHKIKKQPTNQPTERKATALKLEEATSITSRERAQTTGTVKTTPSQTKAVAPKKITALKLKKSTSVTKAWVIQLGSFSNANNATNLRDKLKKAGFTSFVEAKLINNKNTTRVYVGPEKALKDAKQVLARLTKEQKLKGLIVAYDKAQ